MLTIKFHHHYFKLRFLQFTTIRGKSWIKKIKRDQRVTLETLTDRRPAKVVAVELRRIDQIPLDVLKMDGEYPGYKIENSLQFLSLLNSFRGHWMPKLAAEDEVTVITLQQ